MLIVDRNRDICACEEKRRGQSRDAATDDCDLVSAHRRDAFSASDRGPALVLCALRREHQRRLVDRLLRCRCCHRVQLQLVLHLTPSEARAEPDGSVSPSTRGGKRRTV